MVKKLPPISEVAKKDKPTDDKTPSDQEEEVVNGSEIHRMEDLRGIGPVTANKLRELGYTVMGLATGRADEIAAEMKISFVLAKEWVTTAQNAVLAKMKLKTATQLDKERKAKQIFFKTGSKTFNDLIGGGFGSMRTTGLSGRFATGKSQSVFDAIVDCISVKGLEAVYIETEPDTFNLDRFKEIAEGRKLKFDGDKLWICECDQIPTMKAQYLQYKVIQKELEKGAKIGFIGIDSFNAKIRPGYSRREMLPVRTRELTEHFLLIDFLAARYNTAWVLTCQVIGAPDPGMGLGIKMKTGDSFYPVGGEYLLHSVNVWVSLQQVKTELWEAVVYDSSYLPRAKCNFVLSKKGLEDGVR